MSDPSFWQLSAPPLAIAVLAALAAALPGNFLVLRRQALLGDAISHVVLPGMVAALLITGSASSPVMLLGAAIAAVLAVGLIELFRRSAGLDPGAATGLVLTTLFAGGVLALEISGAAAGHFDVEHALYGNLESLIWLDGAAGPAALLDPAARDTLPPALVSLALVVLAFALLGRLFWKDLAMLAFDPGHARSLGVPTGLLGFAVAAATAIAAVLAFEAVGAILVIAMIVCPAAAARLVTDRLAAQIGWSALFAVAAAVLGWVLADAAPRAFGHDHAVSAAGMIATVSGAILGLAALAGPRRKPIAARG